MATKQQVEAWVGGYVQALLSAKPILLSGITHSTPLVPHAGRIRTEPTPITRPPTSHT